MGTAGSSQKKQVSRREAFETEKDEEERCDKSLHEHDVKLETSSPRQEQSPPPRRGSRTEEDSESHQIHGTPVDVMQERMMTSPGFETTDLISLEDFEILSVLGRGKYGKVMKVKKVDTGKLYALKTIKKSSLSSSAEARFVIGERRILEDVSHPYVVGLHFAWQTESKLYFVIDIVEGGELFFHLKQKGKFSVEETQFILAELLLAMSYLHEKGIIYRDLKPENVLLTTEGHVKLTDFGISMSEKYTAEDVEESEFDAESTKSELEKNDLEGMEQDVEEVRRGGAFSPEGSRAAGSHDVSMASSAVVQVVNNSSIMSSTEFDPNMTGDSIDNESEKRRWDTTMSLSSGGSSTGKATGSTAGTLDYMAPEVLKGEADSSAVDVWGFGVLAYEMLTGTHPFGCGGKRIATMRKIMKAKWALPQHLPEDANSLLRDTLVATPDRRPTFVELKAHPFFSNVDWALLERREGRPVFRPPHKEELSLKNFDTTFTRERPVDSPTFTPVMAEVREQLSKARVTFAPTTEGDLRKKLFKKKGFP
mmetsp:Transcript_28284/g.72148  ORF Transcript_28284/g.72148 Transcript_28284/m.72148 type:complete len:537 (-) Transcript_28284:17-1627(-)|eukprot:CAMPEP_0113881078 /NCGR_PEP_ID=MMETSP0780_2-20120614/8160_1 /TAXON_ID=652834 /ORGANISM="Palpitomonas bilix" /LENGTH=536 /DNA_ID=CAMNT_0000867863 /DNA_START=251 /DNA_END=1861 /DNA_ORIENTATION=+ /assembly_acc=CAM_ASM_000599